MNDILHRFTDWFQTEYANLAAGGYRDSWPVIAAFAGGVIVFWLIGRVFTRRELSLDERLDQLESAPPSEGVFGGLTPALAAQLPESEKERGDFRKLLRSAGLYSPSARNTIYALRFVLLFVPLVIAGTLAVTHDKKYTLPILIVGGIVAAALSITPRLYVFFRRRKRSRAIRQGLPDTMDMLGMCMSGGLGLSHSLAYVARQLPSYPELAEELTILRRQAEVGSLPVALADFGARVDLPEVRQLANLLTRGDRLGTKLAGNLADQSDHIRVARKQAATLQANKTPVKLVLPLMVCFAPAALMILTAPAFLELKEFFVPTAGQSILADNSGLRQGKSRASINIMPDGITDALNSLDQDMSAARAPQ
jgi:tight adherence protein C